MGASEGAHPSTLEGDERPWLLFFNFDWSVSELKELSWEKFSVEFERANLAFVYQDVARMADSTFLTSSSNAPR